MTTLWRKKQGGGVKDVRWGRGRRQKVSNARNVTSNSEITSYTLRLYSAHTTLPCFYFSFTPPSPLHYSSFTPPSLFRYFSFTPPLPLSLHHYPSITPPSLHHYPSITPSPFHHSTITPPSLLLHPSTITPPSRIQEKNSGIWCSSALRYTKVMRHKQKKDKQLKSKVHHEN